MRTRVGGGWFFTKFGPRAGCGYGQGIMVRKGVRTLAWGLHPMFVTIGVFLTGRYLLGAAMIVWAAGSALWEWRRRPKPKRDPVGWVCRQVEVPVATIWVRGKAS